MAPKGPERTESMVPGSVDLFLQGFFVFRFFEVREGGRQRTKADVFRAAALAAAAFFFSTDAVSTSFRALFRLALRSLLSLQSSRARERVTESVQPWRASHSRSERASNCPPLKSIEVFADGEGVGLHRPSFEKKKRKKAWLQVFLRLLALSPSRALSLPCSSLFLHSLSPRSMSTARGT